MPLHRQLDSTSVSPDRRTTTFDVSNVVATSDKHAIGKSEDRDLGADRKRMQTANTKTECLTHLKKNSHEERKQDLPVTSEKKVTSEKQDASDYTYWETMINVEPEWEEVKPRGKRVGKSRPKG
jgi:hypothetical protein